MSDNVRIGLQTEKGFNAGGFTFNFETFSQDVFEEETLWNYEAFLRGDFLDGRLGVNANVFYTTSMTFSSQHWLSLAQISLPTSSLTPLTQKPLAAKLMSASKLPRPCVSMQDLD